MNQVPWRRILERADGGVPNEGGAAIINLHDRAPGRQKSRRSVRPEHHAERALDLENELAHALKRAECERRERAVAGAPRQWDPTYSDQGIGRAPLPPQRSLVTRRQARKSGSRGRNLLAIALSVAVIGFAFHQVSGQWPAAPQDTGSAGDNPATGRNTAAVLDRAAGTGDDGTAQTDRSAGGSAQSERNRVDLRPSLATEGRSTPAAQARETPSQAVLDKDIQEAAKLLSRAEKERTEVRETKTSARTGPEQVDVSTSTEQMILRRGHRMMEQGHIAGARLVFESLAEQKSALGAFALAQTYDPNFLKSRPIPGAKPDKALAAKWYQYAAQLTSSQSSQ
jgi:hypothetical protein